MYIKSVSRPVNAFLPIFWAFVILCFLVGLRLSYQSVYKSAIFRRFLVWFRLRFGSRLQQSAINAEEQVRRTQNLIFSYKIYFPLRTQHSWWKQPRLRPDSPGGSGHWMLSEECQ